MKYLEWNHIIGEYFFNPSNAGKEILLYLTQKEISELGVQKFGFANESQSWEDYCKAIKCGFPGIVSHGDFIDKFLLVANKWKSFAKTAFELNNKSDLKIDGISIYSPTYQIAYPFYLGFLIAFVIPLTDNVNTFRANSFFPPFNVFLTANGITKIRTGTIKDVDWVWSDLEKWSKEFYKTDYGFFIERRLGNQDWIYVNKVFSQCLLTPKNIRDIPNIFWKADIAPNSIIPEKQFLRIIKLYGETQAGFGKRIVSIVNDENNPLRKVIIDIVRREYINWKGDVIQYGEDEEVITLKSGWIYATLLSAFNLNKTDETFNHFYYLYSQNDFPDELNLGGNEIVNLGNGYSKPIITDFNQSLNLHDEQNKWRASATQNEIVLYTSGSYFGISADNLIETDKISRQSTMYLLCADSQRKSVDEWGRTFEKGDFNLVEYDNIPKGFNLYKFRNPQQSHVSEEILKVTTRKKFEFRGGIKIENRSYLKNLLPRIHVEGAVGGESLFLHFSGTDQKILLRKSSITPEEFIIPDDVICNQEFFVKIENENLDNSELPYKILDIDFDPLDIVNENLAKRNKFGEICDKDDTQFVIGSNTVYNNWVQQSGWTYPFFSSMYNRIEFVPNNSQYALQRGNLILQILSTKRNFDFQEFSEIVDSIEANEKIWELSRFQQSPKYIKQISISFYDYLGCLDYDYALNRVLINKPQFVVIPSAASIIAILIGGRSKSFINALQDTCNEIKINVEIISQTRQLDIYYLPDLVRLTPALCKNCTEAWRKLQEVAEILNIDFKMADRPYFATTSCTIWITRF
jgi:hypothetical protein